MYVSRICSRALRPPGPVLRAGYASKVRSKPSQALFPRKTTRRPPSIPPSKRRATPSQPPRNPPETKQSPVDAVSTALRNSSSEDNNLLSPVNIPEDPNSIINENHPAASILANSSIVVTRQLEMMNVLLGFEQANKYVIMDPHGNHIGYMAERDLGMGNMMKRQFFNTHRSFTTHVFDKHEREVLRFHRPFSWISSRIGVYDPLLNETTTLQPSSQSLATTVPGALTPEIKAASAQVSDLPLSEMRIIGEAQQQWAPLRRKYNLFLYRGSATTVDPSTPQLTSGALPLSNSKSLVPVAAAATAATASSESSPSSAQGEYSQFAYIDERFLSWDFSLLSSDKRLLGSVNRNFSGFGREIFTDTGVYALRMDAAALAQEPNHLISKTGRDHTMHDEEQGGKQGMTLDQRAVMLATAVTVDFDYFSRHSGAANGGLTGGFFPFWIPGWGGAGGGAAAEAGAGAEAAGVGGAVEEAGGAASGGIGRAGVGATGEGAAVGAAGAGGYEAMQRGGAWGDDASPTSGGKEQFGSPPPEQQPGQVGEGEDLWGNSDDPWGSNKGGEGGDGGDGGGFDVGDWF